MEAGMKKAKSKAPPSKTEGRAPQIRRTINRPGHPSGNTSSSASLEKDSINVVISRFEAGGSPER